MTQHPGRINLTEPVDNDRQNNAAGLGKSIGQLIREANFEIEALGDVLTGPVFTNPFPATTFPQTILNDSIAVSGGAPQAGVWIGHNLSVAPSVVTAGSQGTGKSIKATLNVGPLVNPAAGVPSDFYLNFNADQARGTHSHLLVYLRLDSWNVNTDIGQRLDSFCDLVVSDVVDLNAGGTGTAYRYPLPTMATGSFSGIYVPLRDLTKVRSIGIASKLTPPRDISYIGGEDHAAVQATYFNTVQWARQTEADVAAEVAATTATLIPPTYVPSVADHLRDHFSQENKSLLGLTPGFEFLSNADGVYHARQFGIPEDGVTESVAMIQWVMDHLPPRATLRLSASGVYAWGPSTSSTLRIRNRNGVTLDLNGCTIINTATAGDMGPRIVVYNSQHCQVISSGRKAHMVRKKDHTALGSELLNVLGAPVTVGNTKTLSAQGDSVSTGIIDLHRDEDWAYTFDMTLSQSSTAVAEDVVVEVIDGLAPPAPTSVVQSAAEGAVVAGTYYYRVSYVDCEGNESGMGPPAKGVISAAWGRMSMTIAAIPNYNWGTPIVARTIYRSLGGAGNQQSAFDEGRYAKIGHLEGGPGAATFIDNTMFSGTEMPKSSFSGLNTVAGSIEPGRYMYFVTTVHNTGMEKAVPTFESWTGGYYGLARDVLAGYGGMQLTNLPGVGDATCVARRIYRGRRGDEYGRTVYPRMALVAEIRNNTATTYTDTTPGETLGFTYSENEGWTGDPIGDRCACQILRGGNVGGTYRDAQSFTQRVSPTTTPANYRVSFPVQDARFLRGPVQVVVRKTGPAVNTITVHNLITHTRRGGTENGQLFVDHNCADILFEDIIYEGASGYTQDVAGHGTSGIVYRNIEAYNSNIQGGGITEGDDILFDHCKWIHCGVNGVDFEPELISTWTVNKVEFRDCEWLNGSLYYDVVNQMGTLGGLKFIRCKSRKDQGYGATPVFMAAEAVGNNASGGSEFQILNCDFAYQTLTVGGRNIWIDGISCYSLSVVKADSDGSADNAGGGGYWSWNNRHGYALKARGGFVTNVKLNGGTFSCSNPYTTIGIISSNYPSVAVATRNPSIAGPWSVGVGASGLERSTMPVAAHRNKVMALDPGPWARRFPDTYKGIAMPDAWFPRGLDLQGEAALEVRGISSGSGRSNNLKGAQAVSPGAAVATILFPTRAYQDITTTSGVGVECVAPIAGGGVGSRPSLSQWNETWAPPGTMALGTYRYRIAARPLLGGPLVAKAEFTVTLTGTQNAVRLKVDGLVGPTTHVEGITVFRTAVGGGAGAFTTRYDIIPTRDIFALSVDSATGTHYFIDFGTQMTASRLYANPDVASNQRFGAGGFDPLYQATPTTEFVGSPSWDGTKWISVDETGYQPNNDYSLNITPSWLTTVAIPTQRVNGADLTFGTVAPGGGGTARWTLVD